MGEQDSSADESLIKFTQLSTYKLPVWERRSRKWTKLFCLWVCLSLSIIQYPSLFLHLSLNLFLSSSPFLTVYPSREHSTWGEGSQYSWYPVWLDWIWPDKETCYFLLSHFYFLSRSCNFSISKLMGNVICLYWNFWIQLKLLNPDQSNWRPVV